MSERTILLRDGMAAQIANADGPDDGAEKTDMRSGIPRRADDAIALIQLNHAAVDQEWLPGMGQRDDATRYAIDEPDDRRERLATIGNFAAGVAHEINNPLGAVLASVQAALGLLDRDERELLKECLETAQAGSRRCIDIVRGLLRFCRDEPAHRIPFDVCEICRFAISLTRSYAEERGCRLELRLPTEHVEIPCGPIELEIAFVNLLRNAVEAGATRIETGVEVVGAEVRIVFRDNGRGIRPADLAHVLEPLYSSRTESGGTGVGLGIVHGIVVDHRGKIEFETYGTRGTSVYVVLPLDARTEDEHPNEGQNA